MSATQFQRRQRANDKWQQTAMPKAVVVPILKLVSDRVFSPTLTTVSVSPKARWFSVGEIADSCSQSALVVAFENIRISKKSINLDLSIRGIVSSYIPIIDGFSCDFDGLTVFNTRTRISVPEITSTYRNSKWQVNALETKRVSAVEM